MHPYRSMFLEIVLPVLAMLAAERFAVYRFLRTPEQLEWVRRHRWLRPNAISRCRYPMGFVSVALILLGWPKTAFLFFAFWMITDLTDGEIARRCGLSTERGETIDPLSDKFMYTPVLLYFAWLGLYPWELTAAFVFFDVVGQASRRFIPKPAANLFGKAKTFLVVVLLIATALAWIYGPLPLARILKPLLGFCVGLAFCSAAFKIIPNYWYANILSLMNLVCGLGGIWVILTRSPPGAHESLVFAFGLVFLGQFLDLFDGRAAERWGSTPRGEIFDDVADGTSFGATVGLIVLFSFEDLRLGAIAGSLHLVATIYRLARFVVEKRKAGIPGGVRTFSGMPSPGGALLAGSGCLLLPWDGLRFALVVITAFLMVSRVPYAHFGRSALPRIPKIARVGLLVGFVVLLAYGVRTDDYSAPVGLTFAAALAYLFSPLFLGSE
ncbi:MAG: CDP-alcohol phosphatidyltransferase family protein [Deltaproteobacteria bacterium]|nr:CDP-alcohol phosphatidyltransferase family protein [Deltaproteobacteria bacterium]